MTNASVEALAAFNFDSKTPAELYARRDDLQRHLKQFELDHTTIEAGLAAVDVDVEQQILDLLREMAFLTSILRRKNAGPPKTVRKKAEPRKSTKQTGAQLLDLL